MPNFDVFSKVVISLEAEDAIEAQKKAERILTHAISAKGFDIIGTRAEPSKKVGVAEMGDGKKHKGAAKLLKSLEKDIFTERTISISAPRKRTWRGETISEFPLELNVDGFDVSGKIVEIPADLRKGEYIPEPVEPEPGEEPGEEPTEPLGRDPGEMFPVPEGHSIYAWNAMAVLGHENFGRGQAVARKIGKAIHNDIAQRLKGIVVHSDARMEIDPDDESPVAISRGIFTSPMGVDQVKTALAEKSGIRSILPADVSEGKAEKHLRGLAQLLGSPRKHES